MLSSDAIRDERSAISDLRKVHETYMAELRGVKARMATQSNRDIVVEMISDAEDDAPDFTAMEEALELAKDEP